MSAFWAPEVFFSYPTGLRPWGQGGWYIGTDGQPSGRTRSQLDDWTAGAIKSCWLLSYYEPEKVTARRRYFWSERLPEVDVLGRRDPSGFVCMTVSVLRPWSVNGLSGECFLPVRVA